jgi:hypothetical protein
LKISAERFIKDNNTISADGATVNDITLKDGAEILSDANSKGKAIPVSYRYVNENGEKFHVLNINTRGSENLIKHYARSAQYAEAVMWLSGERLPAYCYGHPALYMQVKRGDDGSLAVGLWNLHADAIYDAAIELADSYSSVKFANCTGCFEGVGVMIDKIGAFEFACFELKK